MTKKMGTGEAMHLRWIVIAFVAALFVPMAAYAAPKRIVSVSLCTDEYVFRLAPRDHIAALSILAGPAPPIVSTIADKVGGIPLIRSSAEEVYGRHPDLVVMDQGTDPRLRAHLMEAHIPILTMPNAMSLADVRRVTAMMGKKLGAEARANALLAQMDEELAAARKRAIDPPVRALIYEPNGYVTDTIITDEIMQIAGLKDAATAMHPSRLGRLPVEAVVAAAPELLILNDSHEGAPARADAILHHPALAALKDKTLIVHASLTPLLCPGPWSAYVAGEFAGFAHQARALAKQSGTQ
jgi:iron complex transport system substrate-binding protein